MFLRAVVVAIGLLAVRTVSADDLQTASDAAREQQLVLLKEKSAELDRLQREVEQLRAATGTSQQILVRVEMLEVSLTKLSRLGVGMDLMLRGRRGGGSESLDKETGRLGDKEKVADAKRLSAGEKATVDGSKGVLEFVDALKRNQVAKPLAEPTVVVLSGRPAAFHVGGELPVPASDGRSVEFRKFGTALDLLAVAKGNGRVRLDLRARVSEIDEAHGVDVNGVRVPGFVVRECDMAREVAFGESAVLSGLVQQRVESIKTADGLVKEETVEVGLLVVVTPEVVEE